MAKLILQTTYKGQRDFHQLDSFPVTIGRALDNDVIVSDITVSPHHLRIDQKADGFEITNLSDENGTKLNQLKISNDAVDLEVPSRLQLGDLKVTALLPDTEVAPTRLREAKVGFFDFLKHPFWAFVFVALSFGFTLLGKFITTPVVEEPWVYVSNVLPALLFVFLIALVVACVSRLSTHRWAVASAISIAALFMLLPQILDHLGRFLDYYLTSSYPSSIFENMRNFLLVPLLLVLYMVRVHYVKLMKALGIAFLVTMPISAFFLADSVEQMSNKQGFSPMPAYNKSLSSIDIRAKSTLSIDDFINQASSRLNDTMTTVLEDAEKSE
jgi:hypothetical protein